MQLLDYCHSKILVFIYFLLNFEHVRTGLAVNEGTELKWNDPRVIEVRPHTTLHLSVSGVPTFVNYIVCQAHTQYRNITLSAKQKVEVGTSINGSNIGIILETKLRQVKADWYLISQHNETVNALVYVSYLNYNDPLPGGCNLEFNLENDPNIHMQYTSYATTVEFQWANVGQPRDSSCEAQDLQNELEYELYVYYMTENDLSERTFFSALTNMLLGANNTVVNGKKLQTLYNDGRTKSQLFIGSYIGQGAIYTVVVKQHYSTGTVTMASYIPIVTYACDLNNSKDCVETAVIWKILAVIGGVAGLFLCFVGHRYFKIELFIAGFLAGLLISYILLSLFTSLSTTAAVILATVFGVFGGALWLLLWSAYGLHVISVLLFALVGGYIVSSIIFFTPFGNLEYWTKRFNYGMTFTSGVLLLPVILLSFTKLLNILSCAFIGGYLFVISIDTFLNTGIKNIIVNSIRHAVVDGYLNVIVSSPFLTPDIVLACLWGLLFISGTAFQLYREEGRPDFPPCPRKVRAQQRRTAINRQRDDYQPDEEQPLLREGQQIGYSSNREIKVPVNYQQNELNIPGGGQSY